MMNNRKTLISALAFALLFAGCEDNSYRGYEENFDLYSPFLTVDVAVGDPSAMTKGSGPKDIVKDFAGKAVHVWAFSRDTLADYTVTRQQDSLNCLIDGYPAILDGVNTIAKWQGGRKFFYPRLEYSTVKYDFFAAFLDGSPFDVRRYEDRIELDASIDGSQDILTAKAKLPVFQDEKDKEKLDTADYAFSYLSAEKGDIPIFTMDHGTVRIDLVLIPGIATGNTSRVVVKSATLRSRTDITVTPAAKDTALIGVKFKENSPYVALPLTEDDGTPLKEYTLNIIDSSEPDAIDKQKAAEHQLGAGFFVSPEKRYILNMLLHEPDHGEGYVDREPIDNVVRLTAPDAEFRQGNRYVVRMTVFGERDIYFTVSLADWENSGSFVIDQDADSELLEMMISAEDMELAQGETAYLEPGIIIGGVPVVRDDVTFEFESLDPDIADIEYRTGEIRAEKPGTASIVITATRPPAGDFPGGTGVKTIKVKVN